MHTDTALENEQVILNSKAEPEYVVLPVARYQKLLQLLEDYGLGQAISEAEIEPRYSKSEALALLESDGN